jgi:hypothetical protein
VPPEPMMSVSSYRSGRSADPILLWKWGSKRAFMDITVVGGCGFASVELGNIRMRMRKVSWMKSKVSFPSTLNPASRNKPIHRSPSSRSD